MSKMQIFIRKKIYSPLSRFASRFMYRPDYIASILGFTQYSL